MVLKKSNTPLNSGATQRGFKRGVYRCINEPSGPLLSITLKGLSSTKYYEDNPSIEHMNALEKIYDYLGFSGPSLKAFYQADSSYWDRLEKCLNISLNNQELWLIPERFHALMNETNFLDGEEGYAEIRVRKVKKIADRDTVHNKESRLLNPQKKRNPVVKRNKERLNGNKRGVQRRHLLTQSRDSEMDGYGRYDWWEQQSQKRVVVELQEEDQMDARVLGCRFEGYNTWKWLKSQSKSENVNGKTSYLYEMYNPIHRRKQTHAVLNNADIWKEEDDYLFDDQNEDDDECVEDCYDYRSREPILYDYEIAPTENPRIKKKHKRGKHQENAYANEVQIVNVNSASSQTTIRHPKGSFQYIARPSDGVENRESKISFQDDVNVIKDEIEESHEDSSENKNINSEKTEIPILFDTFETDDSLVAINLQLPKDNQGTTILSSDKCTAMLGNCFPPVFCVNLDRSDSSSEHGWCLVGTSCSGVSSNEELKWEVTLKNTKSSSGHDNDKVKENFFCNLDSMNKNCVLEFNQLIQMALVSVSVQNASSNLSNEKNESTPKCVPKKFKNNLSVMTYNNAPRLEVCSMEKALKKLQVDQIHNSQRLTSPSVPKHYSQLMIPSENVECDICFNTCDKHGLKDSGLITLLPCNHSFCNECWRSHIFYHTMTKVTDIRCMHTDCKEVLNETMMKLLIPEKHLSKLYLQREERRIDSSPLCQWCPKSKCNKVSIITDVTQHVHDFGCRVVCHCGSSYCFSCQEKPHWPMSCSQATAYRNLLYTLGSEIPVKVTCDVDTKPCPACRYPIEKNEGCPHMTCSMCEYDFCWKCLESIHTYTHVTWSCTADEDSNLKTNKLHTDVINSFPLKFFVNALNMKRKLESISRDSVQGWLNRLNYVLSRQRIQLSFERSVKLEEETVVKNRVVLSTTEIVSFLMDSYSFLEYFYILLSFAVLNEERDKSKEPYFSTRRMMDKLVYTASRLEDMIVGKSIRQILASENTCELFLANGRKMLEKLKCRVASIQITSRDVPAKPIGELDPKKFYRYS